MHGFFSIKKLERFGRLLVPQMLLLLLLLLSLISIPIPHTGPVKPYLILMAIYYWSIYRPTLVPPVLCFFTGILIDILSGLPIGLNAFIFVGVQWIARDQRRFLMGQPYITIWSVFGLVAIACGIWQWGLTGLTNMKWPSPVPGIISILLSLFLFPFVSLLLNLAHRMLPVALRDYP